jgi:hypothetical protein
VKIDAPKALSGPLTEGKQIAAVSNRRLPHDLTSEHSANGALPPLQLGQELEALIVEELDGGRLLLKIGATLIEADSPGGLGAGQLVRLRVEQLQPNVVLHITDVDRTIEVEAARLLRSHLPNHADSGELLDSLQHELLALINSRPDAVATLQKFGALRESIATLLASGTPLSSENLEVLARDGGLFYEAKLFSAAASDSARLLKKIADHDLKGLLLAALQETEARAFSSGLQNALSAQLENLETQQAVNLLAQLDGGAFQLQIPFFTGAGFSTAALAVERDGQGRAGKAVQGKSGYTLLFLLDLENFGRTRVDAHVDGGKLQAVFYVDRPTSLLLVRQELTGFRETLIALGFSDVLLAAKPLREMPQEKQEKFAALAVGAPSSIHLLDMKA